VREEVDPEFLEALKKQNFAKQFKEFLARPMRTMPDEL